jgi:hypothetical protein
MPRLTLRTLLAYMDDTLEPAEARSLGRKVAESDDARLLVERIKKVTRRRGLHTPVATDPSDETADPNTVAEYLDNTLDSATVKQLEETSLESDVHLAEVAACHQILTLVLTEPVRVPPSANQRMYQLVKPPASDPNRRPGNTLPVSGVTPPDHADADDADAALLLGMKRYSAGSVWGTRLAIFGVAALLLAFLAGAVLMALPQPPPAPPETAAGHSYALATPPDTVPVPRDKGSEPVVKPKDSGLVMPPPAVPDLTAAIALAAAGAVDLATKPPPDPGPGLGDPLPPPAEEKGRDLGRVETPHVLVVAQDTADPTSWVRLRARLDADDEVRSGWQVMALPGYKADVALHSKVQVCLWGNVPEQLPPRAAENRVLESRVVFHVPPAGFDADLTLLAGRVYVKATKPSGAKVRVRLGPEAWDITTPDGTANVLVELISWFEPEKTPFIRLGGELPRRQVRLAVTVGAARLAPHGRGKTFDKVEAGHHLVWDSKSGQLGGPAPIPLEHRDALLHRDPSKEGEAGKTVTRLLTEAADRVTKPADVQTAILARLDAPVTDRDRDLVIRLAAYAQGAMADSSAAGAGTLATLVDHLGSDRPWPARQAVVTALVAWLARDVGNTNRLHEVLVSKWQDEKEADRFLELLRGFVSPTKPDPERLDLLVVKAGEGGPFLADRRVQLREAALWNLWVVEQESWVPLLPSALPADQGPVAAATSSDEFMRFLAGWRKRVEEIKKRQPKKP